MLHSQFHIRKIFLEILGHVHFWVILIKLLVKINCPDTELEIIKIRRNLHNKVVRTHISKQGNNTTLIKLYKFFCDTGLVILWVMNAKFVEHVSRYTHNMLFH